MRDDARERARKEISKVLGYSDLRPSTRAPLERALAALQEPPGERVLARGYITAQRMGHDGTSTWTIEEQVSFPEQEAEPVLIIHDPDPEHDWLEATPERTPEREYIGQVRPDPEPEPEEPTIREHADGGLGCVGCGRDAIHAAPATSESDPSKAIALIEEWLEDQSGYDEAAWEKIRRAVCGAPESGKEPNEDVVWTDEDEEELRHLHAKVSGSGVWDQYEPTRNDHSRLAELKERRARASASWKGRVQTYQKLSDSALEQVARYRAEQGGIHPDTAALLVILCERWSRLRRAPDEGVGETLEEAERAIRSAIVSAPKGGSAKRKCEEALHAVIEARMMLE